ncbi:hypothetical protein JCM9957A_16850 [Kineosporia succinea]
MLIRQLPEDSRTKSALAGHPGVRWSTTDWLLAHHSDQEDRAFSLAYAKATNGKRPPRLELVKRPGAPRDRRSDSPGPKAEANARAADLLAALKPGGSGLTHLTDATFQASNSIEERTP